MRNKNKSRKHKQARRNSKNPHRFSEDSSEDEMCEVWKPCGDTSDSDDDPSVMKCMKLSTEVTSWQNQHQIAFWKSRALTLESENKMLYHVLRSVCCERLQGSLDEFLEKSKEHRKAKKGKITEQNLIAEKPRYSKDSRKTRAEGDEVLGENGDGNIAEFHEKSYFEMRDSKIQKYGVRNSPKIIGMETALQYSFDNNDKVLKPPYWPNIPFNA